MHASPSEAKPCATCGDLTGRGYPACPGCAEVVDRPWESAWAALSATPSQVAATPDRYGWQCTDRALRELRCPACDGELAAGAPDCPDCAAADATRWSVPATTRHDHTLRTAVTTLRAPAWHRGVVVSTWRLLLPFVLTGTLPSPAEVRDVRTLVIADRYEELADQETYPLTAPLLPWRHETD